MGFLRSGERWWMGLGAAAATALLMWLGTGLNPWWPLVWVGPVPVLWFALRARWGEAGAAAAVAWFAGEMNLFGYLRLMQTPARVWVLIFGVGAVVFALAVLLFRALARRGAWWSAVLAFPAAWVSWEYVVSRTSPHGTAMNLAYTQLRFVPVLQVASVTGLWGLSYVLLLFAATMAVGLHLWAREPRRAMAVAGMGLAVTAVVLVGGVVRMERPSEDLVRVGLVVTDQRPSGVTSEAEARQKGLEAYAAQVRELAGRGAKVIVLSEGVWAITPATEAQVDGTFQPIASASGVTVVVGVIRVEGGRIYDEARVYAPDEMVRSYDKEHLLPPFESMMTPGKSLLTWQTATGMRGVAICKDMDFTGLARRYGEAGAGLMLVPGGDFKVDGFWHGHMAVMRAVEDGFSLVRSASRGFLTVTDDRGRVLGEMPSNAAPFATLAVEVPARHDATIYERFGNWFAWVALALLGCTLVEAVVMRGRNDG
ncbi:MAG: nitrilase-related carbon-nitrogen hydrolase [Acidobacteriaceae bacterium]